MSNLDNINARIDNAAKKLNGFKKIWCCDVEARMDNGAWEQFSAVRVWHRSPHTDQPHKGGLRFHPSVNMEMMKAHAVEMSFKCWLMGIEWGGAKGGIAIDPSKHSAQELKNVTEALVDEMDETNILGPFRDVPAPDVGTTPKIMNWIRQRYAQRRRSREDARFAAVVTGKPIDHGFGGIPGRVEATGYGLVSLLHYIHTNKNMACLPKNPHETTLAVMGFGNVGAHVALFAERLGYRVVAISDVYGGVYSENGILPAIAIQHMQKTGSVAGTPGTIPISNENLLLLPCTVLIPAALENAITKENAPMIQASIVIEGANGPTTPEADAILESRGITVIPDILANAGGVTVSFFEWARNVSIRDERVPNAEQKAVLDAMSTMLRSACDDVFRTAEKYNTSYRNAAYITAIDRVTPLFRTKHMA